MIPLRTIQRFLQEDIAPADDTVRIVDPPPGEILEIDFAELGRLHVDGGRGPKVYALVCTPGRSRYTFVWPCLNQELDTVLEGLEAAWGFYGGVFRVVVPDNPRALVSKADPLSPRLNATFLEYAQSRGFVIDTARVRHPKDKARVERSVRYVRDDFFRGERFMDLAQVREAAPRWCRDRAGARTHGTTQRQPRKHFEDEELPKLLPAPEAPYDTPVWTTVTVGRDGMIAVDHAIYSVPFTHRGDTVRVRTDRVAVKVYRKAALIKIHVRVGRGGSVIDPVDLPPGTVEIATRDGDALAARAVAHGATVAEYARRLIEGPLPWTRMRHVYRLLGLCRSYGDVRVGDACRAALDLDVVDVTRVARMLELGRGPVPRPPTSGGKVLHLRFARSRDEFTRKPGAPDAAS